MGSINKTLCSFGAERRLPVLYYGIVAALLAFFGVVGQSEGRTEYDSLAPLSLAVSPGKSIQAALNAMKDAGGGSVILQAGDHIITGPLQLPGNTRVQCEKGAILYASTETWLDSSPDPTEGVHFQILMNANFGHYRDPDEPVLDENISVEGCGFHIKSGGKPGQGIDAIRMRKVRHVKILDNTFTADFDPKTGLSSSATGILGDAVAFLASDDTLIDSNSATGAVNACWDHWEGPRRFIVTAANTCITAGAGTYITGVDTETNAALVARHGRIGGVYRMINPGVPVAAITIMGSFYSGGVQGGAVPARALHPGGKYAIATSGTTSFSEIGAPSDRPGTIFTATGRGAGTGTATCMADCGSGVSDVTIDSPDILWPAGGGNGTVQQACIAITGHTGQIDVVAPTCNGGFIKVLWDVGGTPHNIAISSPTITNFVAGGGATNPIEIDAGDRISVLSPQVIKGQGKYTYAIGIGKRATRVLIRLDRDIQRGSLGYLADSSHTATIVGSSPLTPNGRANR